MAVYVDEWGIPRTIPDFGADPSGSTAPNPALGTNPVAPPVRLDEGAGRRGGGLAAMLAPSGSWSSRSVNSHPFQGLQGLLESSILSRLMSGAGQEGGATRGLEGGGLAWNHLEDPFGRLTKQTETWNPAAAVVPPRNRMAPQLGNYFTKSLDANGWPVEANPGPWKKTGYQSDGTPTQYRTGAGAPMANPYL